MNSILAINKDKKILTIDDKQYEFSEIHMSKYQPMWIIWLVDGSALIVNFNKGDKPTP